MATKSAGAGAARKRGKRAGTRTVRRRRVKRVLNVLPSLGLEKDWTFENAQEAGLLRASARIPASRDLRESWWTVADQGATGSCVGWATADSVLRWMFVKAGRLGQREQLSVRFIWMAAKESDEFTTQPTTFIEDDGTSLKAALDVARKYGAVADKVLPFKSGKLYPYPAPTFYALASKLKIKSYFNLKTNLGNWRSWLATHGPILTRLDVDASWDAASETRGKLEEYKPRTARGGHAIALVGYTADAFIVRNSWGRSWGDKGYAYASWKYAQAAFTEAYGVTI